MCPTQGRVLANTALYSAAYGHGIVRHRANCSDCQTLRDLKRKEKPDRCGVVAGCAISPHRSRQLAISSMDIKPRALKKTAVRTNRWLCVP